MDNDTKVIDTRSSRKSPGRPRQFTRGMVQLRTTVPEDVFNEIDIAAAEGGVAMSQWLRDGIDHLLDTGWSHDRRLPHAYTVEAARPE